VLRLSWSTFTERWQLFTGAALIVCLGVALVQSSLLVLISAATLDIPAGLTAAERARFADGTETAITLSALTLAFSAFLAVFIVGSTFAFTVTQRRRDLALLRLAGGGRGQLHRLLLWEAVLLGAVGTAAGVPAGLAVMTFQSWLLRTLGFVPPGFHAEWRTWIVAVSAGVGFGVAVAGVLVAARRAAMVRPLEALRETGEGARVMTPGRWVIGLLFAAGAVALIIVAPLGGSGGGQAMAINVALCASVALSALSPLIVPGIARLLPERAGGVLGELARAGVRDGVRRSAATAAPVIVLVALVVGQSGTLTSFAAAGEEQQRRDTAADLVVEAVGPVGDAIAAVPGVASASTEVEVPVAVTWGSGEDAETEDLLGLVIDPAAYAVAHRGVGSLDALRGPAVAGGPAWEGGSVGETVGVRVGAADLRRLPVVATVPAGIDGGADLLLPPGLAPAADVAAGPSRTFVTLAPGADAARVSAALAPIGGVHGVEDWIARDAAARSTANTSVFLVLMGLGSLYALIGVVNAVVIGAAARRSEFAAARASGLTRGQVVRTALLESWIVTLLGLLLGGLAAAGSFVAVLGTTTAITGTGTLALPWPFVLTVAAVVLVVTTVTSVLTTRSATRGASWTRAAE
jgi:putative ABC transport system permease protein